VPVNGKQKGNRFERDIANTLSTRFREHTGIEQAFRRNPDSGSFFGGKNVERAATHDTEWAIYGDLICPRKFKFAVECKNYKTAPILNAILTSSVTDWDGWISQARQDATAAGKEMMLIIKYNRTAIMAIFNKGVVKLPVAMRYKDTEIFMFDDILRLDDSFFFEEE
jgi:hypothetical protein